jgi:hypothetical protein
VSRAGGGKVHKLKKNKDFTFKSLFLKDLAVEPAKVLIPKDRPWEGGTAVPDQ